MITIKIGGSVVDNLHPSTISDIKKVVEQEGVILVHGGGKEVTKVTEQLGKEPKFVVSPSGIKSRYTDKETSEIFTMVMSGRINKAIVQMLQKNGINAIGLSGMDGKTIEANRKKKLMIINEKGRKLFNEIFEIQKKRIHNALLNSSSEEVINFDNVLNKIING